MEAFQGPPRLHSELRTARAIQRDPASNNKETNTKDDEQDCNATEHLYLEYFRFYVNLGKPLAKYPGVLFPEKSILFCILSTTQRHGNHLLVFSDGIRPLLHPPPTITTKKKQKKNKRWLSLQMPALAMKMTSAVLDGTQQDEVE